MKFEELNDKDKKYILDCMILLSIKCNKLYSDSNPSLLVPNRTECEILESMSTTAHEHWRSYLNDVVSSIQV